MSKMPRVRQIAEQVRTGAITFQKGLTKVIMATKNADMYEREAYIHNFEILCA